MLEFVKVRHPDDVQVLLRSYDSLKDTWIVSDLKSKQEVQSLAVDRHGYYCDDAIMRVNDFWRLWIRRLDPTLHVVSADFIRSLVQQFVDDHGAELQIVESEVSTLNKAIQEFAPILLHPESDDILREWVNQQKRPKSWWRWYQSARLCMNHILHTRRCLDAQWSAAYLQLLDLDKFQWPRKMYVDLGSEMTSVEMGLFKLLAQQQQVVIVTPDPHWKERFPYLLNTYRENEGYGSVRSLSESADSEVTGVGRAPEFIRLSTQLAEVKLAVSRIRQWAENDRIDLNRMAIVAADIESYWTALQYYLDEEGLPYRKETVAQMNSFGSVQSLLAQLQNYSDDVAWDSLERACFSDEESELHNFEKFKALFYQLYDADDLGRDLRIKNLFHRQIDNSADTERDEFLAFLVKIWMRLPSSQQLPETFELIFKDFLAQSLNIKMRFSRWVSFFKNRLRRKEVQAQKAWSEGIRIVPLMSAHLLETDYRIYIGLNDEFYHRPQRSLMSLADSLALKNQFDLALDFSEESFLDFNLRWQSLKQEQCFVYTSAHVSFASEPLSASLYFIENSPQSIIAVPGIIRADERQNQMKHRLEEPVTLEAAPMTSLSLHRLRQDLNGYKQVLPHSAFTELSVSDAENYSHCAFKLLASKGFRLGDLPQLGLELEPRQKGSLVHALFEHCIHLIRESAFSEAVLDVFLEAKRQELNLYFSQDGIWQLQKGKFQLLAQKFYEFEKERQKLFETVTEKKYQLYFQPETATWSAEALSPGIAFSVRIDRIDRHRDKKYRIIYDYKNTANSLKNYEKWLTERSFQMLLYMKAIEQNEAESSPVKGAMYYEYKQFKIRKGLLDSEIALNDFDLTKRNKCLIDDEKRQQLQMDFSQLMAEVLGRLSGFSFDNAPYDEEKCQKCDWRKLCRAPHLM